MSFYTDPGVKWQGFGKETTYKKLLGQEFNSKIMFNDNGTGYLVGQYQVEMPLDVEHLKLIHTKYGSQEAVLNALVKPTIDKVIYMTGPLMSSKESSAELKTDLIRYIIDEVENGVYRTTRRSITETDEVSKETRTRLVAEIVLDKDKKPERQESSALSEFGIKVVNFAPNDLNYDKEVVEQIKRQQEITMKVQTAKAETLEAEQRKITAEANGKANVTKAQYEKEVEKIEAVVQARKSKEVAIIAAEQEKESAKLLRDAAELTKQKNILDGQGEAEKRKLIMTADGALTQKLNALIQMNDRWANAFATHHNRLVPDTVIINGNESGKGQTTAMNIMEMLQIDLAKKLSINPKVRGVE